MERLLVSLPLTILLLAGSCAGAAAAGSDAVESTVGVWYFHRSERCPNCQRLGRMVAEVVGSRLATEVASGAVEHREVDFENPANEALVKRLGITRPSLLLVELRHGRVVRAKACTRVWPMSRNVTTLSDYVVAELRTFREGR